MKIMPVSLNSNKQVSFAGDPVKLAKKPFYSSIVKMYDEALDVFQKAEKSSDKNFVVSSLSSALDTKILVSPKIYDKKGGRFWIESVLPGKSDRGTSQLMIYHIGKNPKGVTEVSYTTLLANPEIVKRGHKKIRNDNFLIMKGKEGTGESSQLFWMTKNAQYSDNLNEILKDIQAKLRKFLSVNSK